MRTNKFLFHTFALLVILALALGACTPKPTEAPTAAPTEAMAPIPAAANVIANHAISPLNS